MALSNDLVSQFAKLLNDKKKSDSGTITYGKIIVNEDGQKYVRLDGSDVDTPITEEDDPAKAVSTTTNIQNGDRVSVLIKNHAVTVLGNVSSPSATGKDITALDIAIAKKIQAEEAYFKKLIADEAIIGALEAAKISVMELIASKAEIDKLIADEIRVTDLIAKKINADLVVADSAIIDKLIADKISVLDLIADDATINELIAKKATINSLIANKLDATWANIDFANIDMATIGKLFTTAGIIKDLKVDTGTVTGELIGVTIKGDLIEAGTLKADRLVVKGSDGNYYALNTDFDAKPGVTPVKEDEIHGSVLVKKSIVAEKIDVKDLVAFGATIGGFHITDKSIYSGSKSAVDSSLPGIYQDSTGQFAVGDGNNFLRFYQQPDGSYKLDLSTASVRDLEPVGHASGKGIVRIDDVSSVKHEMNVKVSGTKNLYGGLKMANDMVEIFGATIEANVKTVSYTASGAHQKTLFDNFMPNTQYTIMLYGRNPLSDTVTSTNIRVTYTDGTMSGVLQFETEGVDSYAVLVTDATKSVKSIGGTWHTGSNILYYEKCGVFIGDISPDEYEPYVNFSELVPKKNLIPYPYHNTTKTANGITFTDNKDGSITVNGTCTANIYFTLVHKNNENLYLTKGEIYTLNILPVTGSYSTIYAYVTESDNSEHFELGDSITFTANSSGYCSTTFVVAKGYVANNLIVRPQLELGRVTTEYEPYQLVPVVNVKTYGKNLLPYPYYTKTSPSIVSEYEIDEYLYTDIDCTEESVYAASNPEYITDFNINEFITGITAVDSTFKPGTSYEFVICAEELPIDDSGNSPVTTIYYNGQFLAGGTYSWDVWKMFGINMYTPDPSLPFYAKIRVSWEESNSTVINGVRFTDNGDGTITANGTATANAYFYLQVGTDYGTNMNSVATESATNGSYTISKRMSYLDSDKELAIYIPKGTTVDETLYPQIEVGTTATEWESPKEPITYYVNEDGSVDGLLSVYPTATLKSNNQYVTIECAYNKNNTLGDDRGNQARLEDRIIQNESTIANLTVGIDGINAEVQKNTKMIEDSNSDTNARLIEVEKTASMAMDEKSVNLAITKVLSETGASKLKTSTGYVFDDEGMTVHKSDSDMKTQVSDNGMTVYKKTGYKQIEGSDAEEPVFEPTLTANNEGVDARDLKASTYLIIGGRSRFQNYEKNGEKRTACYWLGG